ncbi:MAG TPA: TPM domain-containing protein [Burkholderiales bacterium]|nr:TPM domain-containing protein [Burkholderiales bacterium]
MPTNRLIRHLVSDHWTVRAAFPPRTMQAIESAIGEQERRHDGELRFAVEAALPLIDLLRGVSARERAIELFGRLRMWDTEQNCGVLIYLLLADKRVEIVADRGIHRLVGTAAWEAICGEMQRQFAAGRFEQGVIIGIEAISDLLATHFPPRDENPDELSNRPVIV